jgi:hypothetical protein
MSKLKSSKKTPAPDPADWADFYVKRRRGEYFVAVESPRLTAIILGPFPTDDAAWAWIEASVDPPDGYSAPPHEDQRAKTVAPSLPRRPRSPRSRARKLWC